MIATVRAYAALLLAAATFLAGCDLINRDHGVVRWGGLLSEYRYHWDAEPGVDILSGAAVPVRAYIESIWLAQLMGSIDYAYPGFTHAVPPNAGADSPNISARHLRPNVDAPLTAAFVGNDYYHILSLHRTGRDVTATLCNYSYAVAKEQADGRFVSVARSQVREPRGISAERVTLVSPIDDAVLAPQKGPEPAPSNDVFGDWQITGYLHTVDLDDPAFNTQWPTYEADIASCVEKAPNPPEQRAFLTDGVHARTDFPTSRASPGWPKHPK